MPFQKGNKLGKGRVKGSVNNDKRAFRESFEQKLGKPIPERLMELIQDKPEEELNVLLSILPYCYPKLATITMPPPLSPEEQALRDRQMGFLSSQIDDDPNPSRDR